MWNLRLTTGLNPAIATVPVLAVAGVVGFFLIGRSSVEPSADDTQSPGPAEVRQGDSAQGNAAVATEAGAGESATPPRESEVDPEAARILRLLTGTWTRESYGTRELTIRSDGTASMVIKPSTVYALVFGPRIDIEVAWELQDGYVDYKVTSATPEDKFEMAKQTWGDHWHEKIHKLDETTLILLGENGDEYVWNRMKADSVD